jgi:hypothetical protein
MAEINQDLKLTENYGRSKRAAQSYSAVALVLSFAHASTDGRITWLDASIDLYLAKIFAYAVAAYFVVVFYLEWDATHTRNNEFTAQFSDTNLSKAFDQMETFLRRWRDDLNSAVGTLLTSSQRLGERADALEAEVTDETFDQTMLRLIDQFADGTRDYGARAPHDPTRNRHEAFAAIKKQWEAAKVNRMISDSRSIQSVIDEMQNSKQAMQGEMDIVSAAVGTLKANFGRLHSKYLFQHRWLFKWADRWGTIVVFAAATLSTAISLWNDPQLRTVMVHLFAALT